MAVLRDDPYPSHSFLVQIPGVVEGEGLTAGFSEVSGLGADVDVIEYRTGNEKQRTPRKLPGLVRYPNLVLKRGVTGNLGLWQWFQEGVSGNPLRADGTIHLMNEERETVLVWNFRRGWPCRYRGPGLEADGSSVAIETLEICHEGLTIE